VDHVQGDDYPVYSDYVGFYYNNVGQRVMCEDTVGKLYVPYHRTCPTYRRPRTGALGKCPVRHIPLGKTPAIRCKTYRYNFQGCQAKSAESLNTAFY